MTQKDLVIQYLKEKGKTFSIKNIDMYRDGGTMGITYYYTGESIPYEIYIDRDCNGVYMGFKQHGEITNEPFKAYLSERIQNYIEHLNHTISMGERIIEMLNK